MDVSQEIHDAGQEVASASGSYVTDVLNGVLNRFLAWPFKAATGCASDHDGHKTDCFGTVVYTTSELGNLTEAALNVSADALAAVIDVCDDMGSEMFRAAYGRIAYAKSLKKTPSPAGSGVAHTTTTLGIIFAVRSSLSLETLAEELDRLNKQTPSAQWPDMVAVSSTGTVNYVGHFPGEQVFGDFLPPAQGALAAYIPPIYVVVVMKAAGAHTFNRMIAFLFAHLTIFSPGARLPNWAEISRAVPKEGLTLCGYQYNLKGELVPVPRQFYNDRYLPPRPVRIEDRRGQLLCTLQYVPWQEGGVVILVGRMPLEGFLMFLGKAALKNGGILKRDNRQISHVLPITQANFSELLSRVQRQSNMVVRSDPTQWVVQKLADEGSSSPFMARLLLGVMRLRDTVFPDPAERDRFDKAYEVFNTLLAIRTAANKIVEMWNDHVRKVADGKICRIQGPTIQIDESIDKELRQQVAGFS